MWCTSGYDCIDLMHITPPVTADGYDSSHHPRYAEWPFDMQEIELKQWYHRGLTIKHQSALYSNGAL